MSPDDVVPLGKTPYYARRAVAEAWAEAGYPPINSATRLKVEQKELFDGWQAGWDGYAPADDPDDPNAPLAHVRGVALDITPTPERVTALSRAGLVRPYSYEPWHWQLPGDVRRFPLITAFPSPAAPATPAPIPSEEDDMFMKLYKMGTGIVAVGSGGGFWIVPSQAYVDLLQAWGITGPVVEREIDQNELDTMCRVLRTVNPATDSAQVKAVLDAVAALGKALPR